MGSPYRASSSFGKQNACTSPTSPSVGFGKVPFKGRDGGNKQFLSAAHSELTLRGIEGPGPSAQAATSMFGKQASSKRKSPGGRSFGSTPRFHMNGFQAQEQGPIKYTPPSSFGRQASSRSLSGQAASFGTGSRGERHGTASPGPNAGYRPSSAFGSQAQSARKNGPAHSFGSASRFCGRWQGINDYVPGPGAYHSQNKSALGTQHVSTKASGRVTAFGTTKRCHTDKVFISEQHSKILLGGESPCHTYQSTEGFDFQKNVLSKHRSAPGGVLFSTQNERFYKPPKSQTVPGPGHYDVAGY